MAAPKPTGRRARNNNFEAMEMIAQAKIHAENMRESLYLVLERDDIPPEVKQLVLDALRQADKMASAADQALQWIFENEVIMSAAAQRGKYKRGSDS